MAVIWGLDLHEIQWGKFKSSYMWNTDYHLRRTKFIIYQMAMIFCVVSESLGTAALADYVDQQDFIENLDHLARVHNNDYVGAASYNIFAGVFVATIFGAAFFFDLFWPERHESRSVKLAWRICSILACIIILSSALTLTVITATRRAYVTGIGPQETHTVLLLYGGSPLVYRHNGRAIAAVVLVWPGFVATCASAWLLWKSYSHNEKLGPFSKHKRKEMEGCRIAVPESGNGDGNEDGRDLPNGAARTSGPHAPHTGMPDDSTMPGMGYTSRQSEEPYPPQPQADYKQSSTRGNYNVATTSMLNGTRAYEGV